MKKNILLAAVAALVALTLNAANDNDKHKTHIGRFADNWYISAGAGVNTIVDNGALGAIQPSVEVNLGKWLTPNWGFRLGYQGFRNRATDTAGWWCGSETFGFHYSHIDWMWNPIGCEKPFQVSPYITAGAINTTWNKTLLTQASLGVGVQMSIRIAGNLSANIDAFSAFAREDTWRDYGKVIAFPSVTAGVSYAFGWGKNGKVGFEKHTRDREVEVVKVEVLRDCNHKDELDKLRKRIAELEAQPKDTVVVEHTLGVFTTYFTLNHSELLEKELYHLMDLVAAVPQDATLVLRGHADKETGTKKRNRVLSEERVNTVYNALLKLGFKGKISFEAFGDEANPYHDAIPRNRCVTIEVRY